MTYELSSGTDVIITKSRIEIIRSSGKSAMKSLFAGRTSGETVIRTSAITGAVFYADYLMIFASGFPSPSDFKIFNAADIKQYPNCIVGKNEELDAIYEEILNIIKSQRDY